MVGGYVKYGKGYSDSEALLMKQVYGVWFPEDDTHFENGFMHENGDYQRDTFNYAMSYVKEPKIFYDIGAHVGLWSLMAHRAGFKEVHAYEPNPKTFVCLKKNLEGKAITYNFGVAPTKNLMHIIEESPGNSGAVKLAISETQAQCDDKSFSKYVLPISSLNIHMCIDRLKIEPHECLVKIDTEGMEAECVLGMDKILYALRPVVCVEQRTNEDALKILQQMGMVIQKKVRKDWILTWKN